MTKELMKSKIHNINGIEIFKLGGSRQVTAVKRVTFLSIVAGKHFKINAELLKEILRNF